MTDVSVKRKLRKQVSIEERDIIKNRYADIFAKQSTSSNEYESSSDEKKLKKPLVVTAKIQKQIEEAQKRKQEIEKSIREMR
jgi:3-dehydroquinate dehydratase